jgi:hypothetical protein
MRIDKFVEAILEQIGPKGHIPPSSSIRSISWNSRTWTWDIVLRTPDGEDVGIEI